MDQKEINSLKDHYRQVPDATLIEMLLVDEGDYQEGAYALLLEEAHKRQLLDEVNQIKKQKEEQKKLQAEMAEKPGMSSDNKQEGFTWILATSDQGQIALIKSILEENGINYYFDNELNFSLSGAQGEGLYVANEFLEKAYDLLKDYVDSKEEIAGDEETTAEVKKVDSSGTFANEMLKQEALRKLRFLILGFSLITIGTAMTITAIYLRDLKHEYELNYFLLFSGIGLDCLGSILFLQAFRKQNARLPLGRGAEQVIKK